MEDNGKRTASWDDLAGIELAGTKEVVCPATSAAAGRDIVVRVRGVAPLELVKILNFPIGEIDAMVQRAAVADEFAKAIGEHVSVMTAEQMVGIMESTVRVGLVEPDPSTGDVRKLSRDFDVLFREIMALTIPKDDAAAAARFRDDGECGSA